MWRPIVRYFFPLLVLSCRCPGQTAEKLSAEVKTAVKEHYTFSVPLETTPLDTAVVTEEEPLLHLDTFKVTFRSSFDRDLLDAAQREAGLKAAKKFSPLKGGLISSIRLGAAQLDLGIWPKLLMDEGNVRRPAGVMLSVDILRIDW